ncbi:hypothetical protein UFOVP1146_117 [uncultured Caudovirales phage]|uniref:Uncharacterized protein n=1 Tax=uncultured Caudovirales phage TaxID=2100421 RepID=A0A6J5P8N7_9CAUD|nr:hypothetical protein UFOVP812_30 [uncultured Caudovirales phage]CAB4165578.1 hypothetical protein UFOVP818_114 [uncultured Caudovirales phage]CAB4186771.1 hypothetical protein UFOVP1146_117 [uncultured Caudovirales phage]CAB4220604.1 hypothetical protein UFOVP1638_27 [uncultured Caudovirales phage]
MSIPLNQLYHFLDSFSDNSIVIYYFYPHGTKNWENLTLLKEYSDKVYSLAHRIICHDQEPLNFNLFKNNIQQNYLFLNNNSILCHSEQRSKQLDMFKQYNVIDAYYWSHAIIAQDWFRYAKHDRVLQQKKSTNYDFLIYNRAWQGTREYRLRFAEMLLENNIKEYCNIRFAPVDGNVHYLDHVYNNQKWVIHTNLESYYDANTFDSTASADYTSLDYITSNIEVVLETLFDDNRLHLTEKTLRPIACRQPFILMATHGSLDYLHRYGFETFDNLIDETYDTIVDPVARMSAVVAEMKRITQLSTTEKIELFSKLNIIAARNQERFFSDEFFEQVTQEYKTNFTQAIAICERERHPAWLAEVKRVLSKP